MARRRFTRGRARRRQTMWELGKLSTAPTAVAAGVQSNFDLMVGQDNEALTVVRIVGSIYLWPQAALGTNASSTMHWAIYKADSTTETQDLSLAGDMAKEVFMSLRSIVALGDQVGNYATSPYVDVKVKRKLTGTNERIKLAILGGDAYRHLVNLRVLVMAS